MVGGGGGQGGGVGGVGGGGGWAGGNGVGKEEINKIHIAPPCEKY